MKRTNLASEEGKDSRDEVSLHFERSCPCTGVLYTEITESSDTHVV